MESALVRNRRERQTTQQLLDRIDEIAAKADAENRELNDAEADESDHCYEIIERRLR